MYLQIGLNMLILLKILQAKTLLTHVIRLRENFRLKESQKELVRTKLYVLNLNL